MAKTKAFSYLRVSGLGQVSGDGFPRQREAVEKYAKARNIEIAQEYRDEGVCGERELSVRKALDAYQCGTDPESKGCTMKEIICQALEDAMS